MKHAKNDVLNEAVSVKDRHENDASNHDRCKKSRTDDILSTHDMRKMLVLHLCMLHAKDANPAFVNDRQKMMMLNQSMTNEKMTML